MRKKSVLVRSRDRLGRPDEERPVEEDERVLCEIGCRDEAFAFAGDAGQGEEWGVGGEGRG